MFGSSPTVGHNRRCFLSTSTAALAGLAVNSECATARSRQDDLDFQVEVLLPRDRVPLSFIIDDSTCLVNMGHFCTPQFATAWPDRAEYQKPWQSWPREIPDQFVRQFGEWCASEGVKGKYSIVPYPACVGWLDRELPGWSRSDLNSSLKLVRELMMPNWDIHPEMITHTRVIDIATGRPVDPVSSATMENSFPQQKISTDQLAEYLAYALRILKNCGLHCEGITTPGGFGNAVKSELSLAVQQSLRDVYQTELPHYFKYVREGDESTEPTLEHVRDPWGDSPLATVNVPAGTGDWFGGWQGDERPSGHLYLSDDGQSGRMAELIQRKQPAVMLCHWPGMYCNGTLQGYKQFQRIVRILNDMYRDQTLWMKPSEMARYWAAKSWTQVQLVKPELQINAPLAVKQFTFRCPIAIGALEAIYADGSTVTLESVEVKSMLRSNTCLESADGVTICVDLHKGLTRLRYRV